MKRLSFLLFILLSVVCLCRCSSTHVVYRMYEVGDPKWIMDSIMWSGTTVSPLTPFSYMNDDSVMVNVSIGTLYRKDKACGSIKIREENGVNIISILDQVKN